MSKRAIYGLLLAGGRSRRMGRDKALLERDGRSQLERTHELLGRHVERVFVSTRPDQVNEPERSRFDQVVDRYDDLGPLAGILSAMDEYPDVDWLVVACDLPNVDDEPLGAIWRAGTDKVIRRFIDEGVRCPRKILIRADTHLIEQDDPRWLDNVNTPEDLAGSTLEAHP